MRNAGLRQLLLAVGLPLLLLLLPVMVQAQDMTVLSVRDADGGQDYSVKLQILLLMTALSLIPGMLMVLTSFTRIVIVLAILRQALGLQDMHNVVLYQDIAQLQEKLARLRSDPQLAQRIARNGRELAVSQFSFARIGQRIVEELEPALRARAPLSLLERIRLNLGV